ncbi:MAG: ABC-type nitrate/sulfonate/bicarbonate transport system periplasmic component [Candidatus Methanohalarchaeum thermophilum]|uniref:ABC-type nitrate/sulfonate/bicarbonate transport system periplasmic component n=1 Tax=Methanohalarchaeum thermophilum TaxID=1903181 RepID=A0A1Q6DUE4_METT1|nr:MAG: ABC-type nitrate/sulfonate/bicarbonate transport system periplasmic component [Candidatus Methanohalarchaeum thermophilum]
MKIKLGLIRGVCQLPAYVAMEKDLFEEKGLDVEYDLDPTAWLLPDKLVSGQLDFTIMPWTRTVKSREQGKETVIVSGSGYEETAVVANKKSDINELEDMKGHKISLPARGGMKDLTTMFLFKNNVISQENMDIYRMPSGDAAMLSFLSEEVDLTTNVEPYAMLAVEMGIGKIIGRGKDILPKSPGCSVTTTDSYLEKNTKEVTKFLEALKEAEEFVKSNPKKASQLSSKYIGINPKVTEKALNYNKPRLDIRGSKEVMDEILELMIEMGYLDRKPSRYYDFSLLDKIEA